MSATKNAFLELINDMIDDVRNERHSLKEKKIRLENMRSEYIEAIEAAKAEHSTKSLTVEKRQKKDTKEMKRSSSESNETDEAPAPAESGESDKKKRKVKEKKDPNMPKRALTAYTLWFQAAQMEHKKKNPDTKQNEIMAVVAPVWKTLSDEEKEPWKAKAAEAKIAAAEAMEAYKRGQTVTDGSD